MLGALGPLPAVVVVCVVLVLSVLGPLPAEVVVVVVVYSSNSSRSSQLLIH